MTKTYRAIMLDPPWPERGGGKIKRGADRHYPLISRADQIVRVIIESGSFRPDPTGCHMYLWVTNNYLQMGLDVMKSLGFRYVTNIAWVKAQTEPLKLQNAGLGQYFRGQHELLLFGQLMGVRPVLKALTASRSVLAAPRTKVHSQKPTAAYEMVERVSPGPYVEIFSRLNRPGWDTWGNESGKLDDSL